MSDDFITASGGLCSPVEPMYDIFDAIRRPWTRPDPNPMPRFAPLWSEVPMLRARSKAAVYRRRLRVALMVLRGEHVEFYGDREHDEDD